MTTTQFLVSAASALLALGCVPPILDSYRRTGELLTPWTMFLAMAIVDVFIPAALFYPVGLALPPWLSPVAGDLVAPAVLIFAVSAVLFAFGYQRGSRLAAGFEQDTAAIAPSKARVVLLLLIVLSLYYGSIARDVWAAGGVRLYLASRLANRFPAPVELPPLFSLMASLKGMLLPVLFAVAGVCFERRHSWRVLSALAILTAAATASTTLFRGVVLTFFIGLAIVERARLHDLEVAGVQDDTHARRMNRRIIAAAVLGVVLFLTYGTARNYLTEQATEGRSTLSNAVGTEASRLVRGEGFVGLLAVLDAYPRDVPFMNGRTIRDMLLLPVPRAIWPGKPLWYGIDDITRAMGWPASTQSAVTMPGELYANFAWPGVAAMLVYGWLFGVLRAWRFHPRLRYAYAFVVVPAMLPTFWMAFTGLMNQIAMLPFVAVGLWFVLPSARRRSAAAVAVPA